ncbi:hypothetical protein [Fictibacillus enclensis]|uniref:hypothetical protein n=1 Tax=Fictibacillus enclensis TaxID=1017270 RepID=UPI0024C05272|nr:hypothetical protein [Fictibacillus enclensis]WHY72693.1 hypothetical protein QNH15_01780 [Fictibacillus enclensis]
MMRKRMVAARQNGCVAGMAADDAALEEALRAAQNRAALAELERARAEEAEAAARAEAAEARAALRDCLFRRKKKQWGCGW